MPALRQADNQDDCAACHMPQSPIDVPHLAFTHHRIGIHTPSAPRAAAKQPTETTLVPVLNVSRLPEIDRQRTLGLAYSQLFDADASQLRLVRQKAAALLDEAMQHGVNDAAVMAARASVAVELGDLPRGRHEAQRALGDKLLSAKDRVASGAILATTYLREGHFDEAGRWAQEITKLRLSPEDWFLLGVCRQRQGDAQGAIQALERVLEIDPSEPGTYRALASLYQATGNPDAARRALERAQVLANRPQ
jgi:tetratricopeptide (TPR) repeat protein